jgi:hypothetical protein
MQSFHEVNPQRKILNTLKLAQRSGDDLPWIEELRDNILCLENELDRLQRETNRLLEVLSICFPSRSGRRKTTNWRKMQLDLKRFASDLQKIYDELYSGGVTTDHISSYVEGFYLDLGSLANRARCLREQLTTMTGIVPQRPESDVFDL